MCIRWTSILLLPWLPVFSWTLFYALAYEHLDQCILPYSLVFSLLSLSGCCLALWTVCGDFIMSPEASMRKVEDKKREVKGRRISCLTYGDIAYHLLAYLPFNALFSLRVLILSSSPAKIFKINYYVESSVWCIF